MNQQDRDDVLQEAIETAAHFLEKRGEFFPFAVVLTSAGEVRHLQARMSVERPDSDDLIKSIVDMIRAEESKKNYRCVGIVSNVNLMDTAAGHSFEAIRVHIDSSEIDSVICYVPYAIEQDKVTLGDVVATKSKEGIFAREM